MIFVCSTGGIHVCKWYTCVNMSLISVKLVKIQFMIYELHHIEMVGMCYITDFSYIGYDTVI